MTPCSSFLAHPSSEFDYFLAEQLGKFVDEVREMSGAEWMGWYVFYARRAQRAELAAAAARNGR